MGKENKTPTFASDPQAALAAYRELGYHIEPDVWTPEEIDGLTRASENLPSFKDGTFGPAMHPHRTEPVFMSALRNKKIVAIMEQLVGGRVGGIQTEFFFCKPGTRGFSMHQDNYYVEVADPGGFASAWSPLQDVSPANGGLVAYPGTHLEPILPVEDIGSTASAGQDPNAHRQQVVLPSKYKPFDLIVKKGAAVFLHGHCVHSSHSNGSNGYRRVLLMTYVRSGQKFREGFTAKRSEVEVY